MTKQECHHSSRLCCHTLQEASVSCCLPLSYTCTLMPSTSNIALLISWFLTQDHSCSADSFNLLPIKFTKEKRSFVCDVYGTYFTALLISPPFLLIMQHNRHNLPEFIMPTLILSPTVSYLQPQSCLQNVLELTYWIRIYCWQPIMAKVISGSCGSCKSWAPASSLPHPLILT